MSIPERSLKAGDECPARKPDTWRLYNMRFCPYAQRTRMVLKHKNIPHETVNVDLKQKPKWLLEMNPWGLVPVLQKNRTVLYESAICDDYLEEIFPHNPLYPRDPFLKARMRILIELFAKMLPNFYALLKKKDPKAFSEIRKYLAIYEQALTGDYFGGDRLGMLDIHIWPWFERFEVSQIRGLDILDGFPKLQAWSGRMKDERVVKETYLPPDLHEKFYFSLLSKNPDYDIGLGSKL